jgi:hypothetical protein
VLLLVAAVSADADYLHVVPQTHTVLTKQVPTIFQQVQHVPTLYKTVEEEVHTPVVYQTIQKPVEAVHTPVVYQTIQKPVEAVHTPVVYQTIQKPVEADIKTLETTDIINPVHKPFHIQGVQTPLVIPTLYQQVPTIYQTVQTQTHQIPTIYKVDEVKVDDDDEDDDNDQEEAVVPVVKYISHKRVVRSADNEDYYISNADNTHIYKLDEESLDEVEDEVDDDKVVPYFQVVPQTHTVLTHQIPTVYKQIPTIFQTVHKPVQALHTPVVKTIKTVETTHIINPVEKLEKLDNVHVRQVRSADNIEVKKTDSHFLNLLTNKPKITHVNPVVIAKTSDVFTHTPINNVATTYIHNTKPIEADSVHIVAPRVSVPTNIPVVTADIKAVKPVHTPISNVGTTLIHNAKTGVQVQDDIVEVVAPRLLVNPVQTPLIKAFNTPVFRTITRTPVVQTPAFKTLETTDIVNPVQTPTLYTTINKPVVTPVQLVNQPIFRTPVVRTVVQTPVEITPGYVAATHGNVHTAPLPEGPSNDGLFASHHINLPDVRA